MIGVNETLWGVGIVMASTLSNTVANFRAAKRVAKAADAVAINVSASAKEGAASALNGAGSDLKDIRAIVIDLGKRLVAVEAKLDERTPLFGRLDTKVDQITLDLARYGERIQRTADHTERNRLQIEANTKSLATLKRRKRAA